MSLSASTLGKVVDASAVETYDSGDDWEIGVGNLIIDLDADLEKDRQKFEMSHSGVGAKDLGPPHPTLAEGLKFVSAQQGLPVPHKESKSKVKRTKMAKDAKHHLPSVSLYGIPEIGGKRQPTEGHATPAVNGSAKPAKEERVGRGRGCRRDKEAGRTSRKDSGKPQDPVPTTLGGSPGTAGHLLYGFGAGGKPSGSPFHCSVELGRSPGEPDGTDTAKKEEEEQENHRRVKKQKTEKVDPLFTVPAPPPPISSSMTPQILPSYFPPTSTSIASPAEQLLVRTRSVGINTCDAGIVTEPECLGPCEPGTSVNLEGIVWHETEEGVLVVNVTWRNKTYVGTLLDCTKHDWAPPRFCESPTSDLEMRGGRGRGKRARSAAAPQPPGSENNFTEVRGLQNKNRGGANSKGRRVNLNTNGRRTPPNCSIEDIKTSPSAVSKRKNKPAMELDLNSSSEDFKTGKRIRTNSRSTPTTPQSKTENFLDHGRSSPILIDCPHPNCNKKYKHINGLRYHQAHAHLDSENKLEFEPESEDKISDCEEALNNVALECSEQSTTLTNFDQLKAPTSPSSLSNPGTPKGKRDLVHNNHSPAIVSKTGKSSGKKKGTNSELNTLPLISNMTVTLENCAVADCNLATEMPKLEAEGLIDKKNVGEKGKKSSNCKMDKSLSKLKATRPIAPAPAPTPPQLIAIPTAAFTTTTTGTIPGLPSLTTAVQATPKSPPLKPIQPKPTIMGEPSTINPALVSLKDKKKKEKRKLKDKEGKEAGSPKADSKVTKPEDPKGPAKDLTGHFLKEHLSKNEVLTNGLLEAQESRMASIKAEADKVYTFTDNAPSPSIGNCVRVENGPVVNGQSPTGSLHVLTQNGGDSSTAKTNSPAYSDISDAADDGGSDSRSEGMRSKTSSPSDIISIKDNVAKSHPVTPVQSPQVKEPHSPYYHGYDPYYSPSYMHSGQPGTPAAMNNGTPPGMKVQKESDGEIEKKEKLEPSEPKKTENNPVSLPPQHQSVITQRHPALAQSLYYGQYAYGLYMDQKSLVASNPAYRQQYEKYYEDQRLAEQKMAPNGRDCERKSEPQQKELVKDESKQKSIPSATISKAPSTPEPGKNNYKIVPAVANKADDPGKSQLLASHHQPLQTDSFKAKQMENHQLIKEAVEMKPVMDSMKLTGVDPTIRYKQPEAESRSWHHYVYQPKYPELQKSEELDREKKPKDDSPRKTPNKESVVPIPPVPLPSMKDEIKDSKGPDSRPIEESKNKNEDRKTPVNWKDSRSARVAVSSPMSQHQSYIQYLHSYPYTQMYDPNHPTYRAVSPVLMHSYPGAYLSSGFHHYPVYGKLSGRDEADKASTSPSINSKSTTESKALDLLQQHANQYRGKSPAPAEKASVEREREAERERDRHSPFSQRHLHTHHHTHVGMGYPLIPGQYDPFQGLTSAALVTQQVAAQASASGIFPAQRRE